MALLNWQETFSVGVKEIDDQHHKIFDIINRLYTAMVDMKENEILSSLVDELVEYGNYHFATEEKYFDRFDYPEKETHEARHIEYRGKINDFKERLNSGGEGLARELLSYLEDWWIHHITISDKKYGPFFVEHGLK